VLTQIVTPFSTPLSARPPIPSIDELQANYVEYRFAKDLRQAARGREASARRLVEMPALAVLEGVVDVIAGTRKSLVEAWTRVIGKVPNFDGKGSGVTGGEGGAFRWKVREVLMEMKPRVRRVLEDSREETPAERKQSINERLNLQGKSLADINILNSLVGRVNMLLDNLDSGSRGSAQKRSQKDNEKGLDSIHEAFKKSLEPQSPHVILDQADLTSNDSERKTLNSIET
jgi:hypothetical protein